MSKSKKEKQQKKQVDTALSILQQIYATIDQACDLFIGRHVSSDPGTLWLSKDSIDEWNVRADYNELPEIREPYHRRKYLQKVTSIERYRKQYRLIMEEFEKIKNQPGKILCGSIEQRLSFFLQTNKQRLTKAELKEWNQLKKILCWPIRVRDFHAAVDEKLKALRSKLTEMGYQFPDRWKLKPIKFSNYIGADDAAEAWDELQVLIQDLGHHTKSKEVPWSDNDANYMPLEKAIITFAGSKIPLSTLSKKIKPDGTILYMRKGQRCKVHIGEFIEYVKTNYPTDEIIAKTIDLYIADKEARELKEREKKEKKHK